MLLLYFFQSSEAIFGLLLVTRVNRLVESTIMLTSKKYFLQIFFLIKVTFRGKIFCHHICFLKVLFALIVREILEWTMKCLFIIQHFRWLFWHATP